MARGHLAYALAALVYPRIAARRHRMPGGTEACRIVSPDQTKEHG